MSENEAKFATVACDASNDHFRQVFYPRPSHIQGKDSLYGLVHYSPQPQQKYNVSATRIHLSARKFPLTDLSSQVLHNITQ